MNDDSYQGVSTTKPLSPREEKIAGMLDQITRLEERAQDAEDQENLRKASRLREEARGVKSALAALRAAPEGQ